MRALKRKWKLYWTSKFPFNGMDMFKQYQFGFDVLGLIVFLVMMISICHLVFAVVNYL